MKIEGSVATEGFAHDGARNLHVAIGGKRGVRRVNEPGENGAIIQAKTGATWQRENGELVDAPTHARIFEQKETKITTVFCPRITQIYTNSG